MPQMPWTLLASSVASLVEDLCIDRGWEEGGITTHARERGQARVKKDVQYQEPKEGSRI